MGRARTLRGPLLWPWRWPLASGLAAAALLSACAAPRQGVDAPTAPKGEADNDADRADEWASPALPTRCVLAAPPASMGWLRDGVGYQIWVRSFRDSDGDGHGDLGGVLAGLDSLRDGKPGGLDLDVDVLWLSPIVPSPSDHGYDATDHDHVAAAFGGDAALDALLKAAHARGLRVVLDLVLNHTSDQHPWFVASKGGAGAAKRSWYVWRDTAAATSEGWGQPWNAKATVWHPAAGNAAGPQWYYGLFWSGMPDLNYAEPAVADAMLQVATGWLGRGVDGFRLDAIRYLVETGPGAGQADTAQTHALLQRLRKEARAARADAALVGEVWTQSATVATYLGGDQLDAAFDFDTTAALRKGIELQSATFVRDALCAGAASHGRLQRFAGNHDMERLADIATTPAWRRLALGLTLLLPGTPWIYQGDELGLPSGDQPGDQRFRLPLPWTPDGPGLGFSTGTPWAPLPPSYGPLAISLQDADPSSLRGHVRQLIALRRAHPALRRGEVQLLQLDGDLAHQALAWVARDPETGERLLVVASFAAEGAALIVPVSWRGAGEALLGVGPSADRLTGPGVAVWRLGP